MEEVTLTSAELLQNVTSNMILINIIVIILAFIILALASNASYPSMKRIAIDAFRIAGLANILSAPFVFTYTQDVTNSLVVGGGGALVVIIGTVMIIPDLIEAKNRAKARSG